MARRKAELLDLLRKQNGVDQVKKPASGEPGPTPVAPTTDSKAEPGKVGLLSLRDKVLGGKSSADAATGDETDPTRKKTSNKGKSANSDRTHRKPGTAKRFEPTPMPWGLIILVVILTIPLAIWMAQNFGRSTAPQNPDPATGPGQNPPEPTESSVIEQPFGVKVITYNYSDANVEIARTTARALIRDFPDYSNQVFLLEVPVDAPENLEIWIGATAEAQDLYELRDEIRGHTLITSGDSRPFESAYITRRPPMQ